MLGSLSKSQIEVFLQSQLIGRIACCVDNKVYIIPITYVYDGKNIYCHSMQGLKIEMMRKNPQICFEVDEIDTPSHWRSVVAWGEFIEVEAEEERKGILDFMNDRIMPYSTGEAGNPPKTLNKTSHVIEKALRPIVFKIKLNEKSGRFEKPS